MIIDRGFSVDNYVGNYKMEFDQDEQTCFIVSEEFNHPEADESPLRKKRIFTYDSRDDDYIFLKLANVDIFSDKSILDFCNQYGLPYSSQLCYDREYWYTKDSSADDAKHIIGKHSEKYSRQDTMDYLEFCRLATQVKYLTTLKTLLDNRQPNIGWNNIDELIPVLTYVSLYSRSFIYSYDGTDPLPKTLIMRFQYHFHFFLQRNRNKGILACPPSVQISMFLEKCKQLIRSYRENDKQITFENVLLDITSPSIQRLIRVLGQLYDPDKDNNYFLVNDYGEIVVPSPIRYSGNKDELQELSLEVLRDAVNEGLTQVTPLLEISGPSLQGEWMLDFQMEGIYMEFFIELAKDSQYRRCANTTCGKFFSASRNRPDKKYCCRECAMLQAKRNERLRKRNKRT